MATVYKIHPAIGICRVGNSPDEFFIGPELTGDHPNPQGGFKDEQCRIKRQAARFRIFAHHDDGTFEEITEAEAEIEWSVHLVNKKAANPGRGNSESNADLTIDPGSSTLTGPNQIEQFDTGSIKFSSVPSETVYLGEIRSDDENHLLVLGGLGKANSPQGSGITNFWGNEDWYDDIADGPVTATVKLRATNTIVTVQGAWVISAPPKFAPHIDNVITLHDRIQQAMVDAGILSAPVNTSYTKDIYPILQRARDSKWVVDVFGSHTWSDPITNSSLRTAIFNRLKPMGNMPDLAGSDGTLTQIQYDHMERWKDDSYTNDWAGIPSPQDTITPDGMDQAALEHSVGGAFFPGIEAGGRSDSERPIINASNYTEPFRLDHGAINPGDISYTMALPWQADFYACAANWWPVPRPNSVIPQGSSGYRNWAMGVNNYEDMVQDWATLGFVVKQGSDQVEVDRCETKSINLLTPVLNFQDVPQGPIGMTREVALPITFEVISPGSAVTLEYTPEGAPSHSQLIPNNTSDSAGPTASNEVAIARLWIVFQTAGLGTIPIQTATVREAGTSNQWNITILANTVARKTVATGLVLDRSGSMSDDRGDGLNKHDSLKQAAEIFVDVMLEEDGVGIIRFNSNAQEIQPVLKLSNGGFLDNNRVDTKTIINGPELSPQGGTSIGDGIFVGRDTLNNATDLYDEKAMVVLTDGNENQSRYIADVADQINEKTYAIGFGTSQNTSAPALQTISGNNGGYMLITGTIDSNKRFILQKYFLQILAGISNAEIVLDPHGELIVGQTQRVPFYLTKHDSGVDVILLTPNTKIVDFRIQAPNGQIIEPWRANNEPSMRYVLSNGVSYYRIMLPVELVSNRYNRGGKWLVLLRIGYPRLEPSKTEDGVDRETLRNINRPIRRDRSFKPSHLPNNSISRDHLTEETTMAVLSNEHRRTIPYSILVHAYSNLSFKVTANQNSFELGAEIHLLGRLSISGMPFDGSAHVWAELILPDNTSKTLTFDKSDEGTFETQFVSKIVGTYQFRIRGQGTTPYGETFTREQTVTAAVWRGGDSNPPLHHGGKSVTDILQERDERLCHLINCLSKKGFKNNKLIKRLKQLGFDPLLIQKCLKLYCKKSDREKQDER